MRPAALLVKVAANQPLRGAGVHLLSKQRVVDEELKQWYPRPGNAATLLTWSAYSRLLGKQTQVVVKGLPI
jgi:hypothetical protein